MFYIWLKYLADVRLCASDSYTEVRRGRRVGITTNEQRNGDNIRYSSAWLAQLSTETETMLSTTLPG